MGSAKGVMPHKGGGKRKVSHIHIEKAGNGVTVHHRMEPQVQKHAGGGISMPHEDGQENVFNKAGQAKKHVNSLMAQMMPDSDGDDAPPAAA